MTDLTLAPDGLAQWVSSRTQPIALCDVEARCTPKFLEQAIGHLGNAEIVSATVNTTGQYAAKLPPYPLPFPFPLPDPFIISDLPPFCDVVAAVKTPGGHMATVIVWVPLAWNGRFLGTAGAGNRTDSSFISLDTMRGMSMPVALRNGFATARTDGANSSDKPIEWGLDENTGKIDWDLTEQWIHRATHEMTLIGKAVTEAIHGRAPQYSYLAGCSGGGRQALVEAQRYPTDYDGIWAADPAINWTKFILAEIWPSLVMKELAVIPPAKFEAFKEAALEACDGIDGLRDGIVGPLDSCTFDPRRLIGKPTPAGEITAKDAEAMQKIWEGPRGSDGRFLWYGIGIGNESWGTPLMPIGLCVAQEIDGKLQPAPFEIPPGYIRTWLLKDLSWDWKTLSFKQFEQLFEQSVREMAMAASDDPDLSKFRAAGGKLILSHGSYDPVIPFMGSVDYYRRIIEAIGSEQATREFARLFICEGDGHGTSRPNGPGLTMASAMAALMNWVE